ncbi:MAG: hypothetical protein ACREOJ_05480, partial [Gemmatimonadaceae bacterium]
CPPRRQGAMANSHAEHGDDLLGDWRCVAYRGQRLPAVEGDQCIVGAGLTLRADGTFSFAELVVTLDRNAPHVNPDTPLSDARAHVGTYSMRVASTSGGERLVEISLHASSWVRTAVQERGSHTSRSQQVMDIDVVVPSWNELRAVVTEDGRAVEYRFER